MLDEKMGKVAKGERKREREREKKNEKQKRKRKKSVPLCSQFLKFYVDGASNEKNKYWCLKMKNLCALMGYLV